MNLTIIFVNYRMILLIRGCLCSFSASFYPQSIKQLSRAKLKNIAEARPKVNEQNGKRRRAAIFSTLLLTDPWCTICLSSAARFH